MPAFICTTCGCQYPNTEAPPGFCLICRDDRQYVNPAGQAWTTLPAMRKTHFNAFRRLEPGLMGIGTFPAFAIGQRALMLRTQAGNILWDCISFLDDTTITIIKALGGLAGIACSHPHFLASVVEWSHAFGAEILLPEADAHWLPRPDPAVRTWSGTRQVLPGVTLVQCGGHFPGSAVAHWADGADGAGVLLAGDTIFVTPGEDRLTFVWSAPNRLPLPERAVRRVVEAVRPYRFDRIYGGWWQPVVRTGAREILEASADRYIEFLRGDAAVE